MLRMPTAFSLRVARFSVKSHNYRKMCRTQTDSQVSLLFIEHLQKPDINTMVTSDRSVAAVFMKSPHLMLD